MSRDELMHLAAECDHKIEELESRHWALITRMRAALILIGPSDMTPMGKRMLERILDEAEGRDDS
jgi:hypothetical protein